MNTKRNIAFTAGGLFLTAAITSIIGALLYQPILENDNYILGGSDHQRVSWGAVLEVITSFAIIGTSVTLYPILRKYNEGMAMATVCFRVAEAIVIIIGILCMLTIITLNSQMEVEAASGSATYVLIGKVLVALHNWTFLYGPNVLLGPSTLMTAYILHKAKLVPRFVSILGLIGGPMIFACGVLVTLGFFDQISLWGVLLAVPVFSYEMSLAIRLLSRGFNRTGTPPDPVQNLYRLAGTIPN